MHGKTIRRMIIEQEAFRMKKEARKSNLFFHGMSVCQKG
jgi:hypothetical protein